MKIMSAWQVRSAEKYTRLDYSGVTIKSRDSFQNTISNRNVTGIEEKNNKIWLLFHVRNRDSISQFFKAPLGRIVIKMEGVIIFNRGIPSLRHPIFA